MKKVNPRRRPATQADVEKAKNEAFKQAVKFAWAIMFRSAIDEFNVDNEWLQRLWKRVNYTSDSVEKGYINIMDLIRSLDEENNIVLE